MALLFNCSTSQAGLKDSPESTIDQSGETSRRSENGESKGDEYLEQQRNSEDVPVRIDSTGESDGEAFVIRTEDANDSPGSNADAESEESRRKDPGESTSTDPASSREEQSEEAVSGEGENGQPDAGEEVSEAEKQRLARLQRQKEEEEQIGRAHV